MEFLEDPQLDRVLRACALAQEPRPLPMVLHALCREIAAALPADVVSVYLRENDDEGDVLVMRANVGFPEVAVGTVCLAIGEGMTGFAAECMRPVMSARAAGDGRYRRFDGLGEERFDAFLALPLLRGRRVAGVLVVQRGEGRPFRSDDLTLAGALSGVVLLALMEQARRRREAEVARGAADGREVRLRGAPVVPGVSVGRGEVLATLQELVGDREATGLAEALSAVRKQLERGLARLSFEGDARAGLERARLVLDDARFADELGREVADRGLVSGLATLARRYALAAGRADDAGEWLSERAAEVSALCRLVAARMADRPLVRPGGILLVAEQPGSLLALEAAMRRASGFVVADRMSPSSTTAQVLRHAGLPAVAEVAGLYDWARPGDPLLVDGTAGVVWVNPSEARVARARG